MGTQALRCLPGQPPGIDPNRVPDMLRVGFRKEIARQRSGVAVGLLLCHGSIAFADGL